MVVLAGTCMTAHGQPQRVAEGRLQEHTVRQVWPQEPKGLPRPYVAVSPRPGTTSRWPVLVVLHGNGGNPHGALGNWPRRHPGHLVVAPQGYQRSWNVTRERSKAPDVAFIEAVLADVQQRYPQADVSNVTLVGFSNGAGLVYRLMIELSDRTAAQVQKAVAVVSSLTSDQHHDGGFWQRADDATANYNLPATPVARCPLLTVHGTADDVVPYTGGRGPGGMHLSAQATAFAWAVSRGYRGTPLPDAAGQRLPGGLLRYDYPQQAVAHLKVPGARHGLGPAHRTVDPLIDAFIRSN